MAGYPGPIIVIDGSDAILATNAGARALVEGAPEWWRSLAPWRLAALRQEGVQQDEHLQPFERPAGTVVIGWRAIRLGKDRVLVLGRDATSEHRLRQRVKLTTQNATMEQHLRDTLMESRQRYKELVEISSDFAWETGPDGRFAFVSPRGALGYSAEGLIGRHPRLFCLDHDDLDDLPLPFETHCPIDQTEVWVRAADGSSACLAISAKPQFDAQGVWVGARGVGRDLTEQVLRTNELARVRQRERMIERISHVLRAHEDGEPMFARVAAEVANALEAGGCGLYRRDGSGAPELLATTDTPPASADRVVRALMEAVEEGGEAAARSCRSDGDGAWLLACRTEGGDAVNGAVAVWRPDGFEPWDDEASHFLDGVAERVGAALAQILYQERLRHLSERDGLTGLFNRRTFIERLEEVLTLGEHGASSLLYIDLDNFKAVNDLRGHQQGDEALRAVTALITGGCRPGDLAGRLGGDEFVLWLARAGAPVAEAVAGRLLAGVESLRPLSGAPARPLGFSIGIAVHEPGRGESVEALLERADTAMYQAKTGGKNCFAVAVPPVSPLPEPGPQESRL